MTTKKFMDAVNEELDKAKAKLNSEHYYDFLSQVRLECSNRQNSIDEADDLEN